MTSTRKLTISAMIVSLYIVILYLTQGVSFGAYQIRIATSLYALAYSFPFLCIPMGIANLISNFLFGGLGILDMVGGFGVGVLTTATIVYMHRQHMPIWSIAIPIIVIPAVCVSAWLSYLLDIPYTVLVVNLLIGQSIPGIVGSMLIRLMESRFSVLISSLTK